MRDDQERKQQQAKELQQDLNKGLSRRAFLDRLKAIGVGFGAAFVFGVNRSEAGIPTDALANLKSTNPVLNDIIEEGQGEQAFDDSDRSDEDARHQLAQYRRIPYQRIPYQRIPYQRVPYRRIPYQRIPYQRIPYQRVPYQRIPYRRIPYQRIPYVRIPYRRF